MKKNILIYLSIFWLIGCGRKQKKCEGKYLYNPQFRKEVGLPLLENYDFEKENFKDFRIILTNKKPKSENYLYQIRYACYSDVESNSFVLNNKDTLEIDFVGEFKDVLKDGCYIKRSGKERTILSIDEVKEIFRNNKLFNYEDKVYNYSLGTVMGQ